jgi:hypothetical protein
MADRTVHVRLYVDTILKMDEGVEVSQFLDEAEVRLKSEDDRVDVIDCQIMNHEVTDSK